jgi:nitroreductase
MDFQSLIEKRQSVRRYQDKPVEPEKLEKLIEAVRIAPSASNSQPWKLIIVNDPVLKDKVALATFSRILNFNRFAVEAPVIAVPVIEKPKLITTVGISIKKREFPLIDIGIASAQFCLQASELGLGTCMLGWFDEKKVKKLLNIPSRRRIGLLITLGYEPEGYRQRQKTRKPKEEMCSFNTY